MSERPSGYDFTPPDIARWKAGNTGIDYVHSFTSGNPGPHVMVGALMHGNEACGAVAVDYLLRCNVRPLQGRLTLAFYNVEAYANGGRDGRKMARFVEEDMNRVWLDGLLDGSGNTTELRRARELRPLLRGVDRLLDLHSMGTGRDPLLLSQGLEKERRFVRVLGYPETVAFGSGHIKGCRLIEYAPFNDPANKRIAVLVECGRHGAADAPVVALDTALYFLEATGVIDPAFVRQHMTAPKPSRQRLLEITGGLSAETADFIFAGSFVGLETFPKQGTVIAHDGGKPILTPHDDCVLIMPKAGPRPGERVLRFAREIS